MGSGAESHMRKGFLIYEEMRKYFTIDKEFYLTLHLIPLNFLIYEKNFIFCFISVQYLLYLQLSIVIHEKVLVGHEQLEADELEAAVLEAGDDATHEAALNAVRLDHDVRPLHRGLGGQKIRARTVLPPQRPENPPKICFFSLQTAV
jgi:hypothetical protein